MVTAILKKAVRIEGSTQALASRLNAPEPTLMRWMAGRAQTPLKAFFAVLDFIAQVERTAPALADAAGAVQEGPADSLSFALGPLLARCERCDGTQFALRGAGPLRVTSVLSCRACQAETVHGRLLATLASDAVQQSRALAARTRRAVTASREKAERSSRALNASARRLR